MERSFHGRASSGSETTFQLEASGSKMDNDTGMRPSYGLLYPSVTTAVQGKPAFGAPDSMRLSLLIQDCSQNEASPGEQICSIFTFRQLGEREARGPASVSHPMTVPGQQ